MDPAPACREQGGIVPPFRRHDACLEAPEQPAERPMAPGSLLTRRSSCRCSAPWGPSPGHPGTPPNQSWHNSHAFPNMSYSPRASGRFRPTGCVLSLLLSLYQAMSSSRPSPRRKARAACSAVRRFPRERSLPQRSSAPAQAQWKHGSSGESVGKHIRVRCLDGKAERSFWGPDPGRQTRDP